MTHDTIDFSNAYIDCKLYILYVIVQYFSRPSQFVPLIFFEARSLRLQLVGEVCLPAHKIRRLALKPVLLRLRVKHRLGKFLQLRLLFRVLLFLQRSLEAVNAVSQLLDGAVYIRLSQIREKEREREREREKET